MQLNIVVSFFGKHVSFVRRVPEYVIENLYNFKDYFFTQWLLFTYEYFSNCLVIY